MTRHERTIIAAEQLPSIDVNKTPAREINPRHDVAQIATRGHVLTARIEALTKTLTLPAVGAAALVVAASFGFGGMGQSDWDGRTFLGGQKRWLSEALTYDPNTYFDLGGGLRGGPDLAWLGSYSPTPESLKPADYSALVKAVAVDSGTHGTDAASWEAVAGLQTAPTITRPAKFKDNAKDLKNGVVAVPEADERIVVAAYVDARWAFAVVARGRCMALVGPAIEGCSDNTRSDGSFDSQAVEFVQTLKPQE